MVSIVIADRSSSSPAAVCLLAVLCLASCGTSEGGDAPEAPDVPEATGSTESRAAVEQVAEAGPPDLTGWQVGTGHRGVHTLAWRPVGQSDVPRNEEFEIDVLLLRDEQPLPGMRLAVTGWMPEHEHGMVRSPLIEDVGEGRYLVSGMLLHMRGSWQLRYQVFSGRDTEIVTFDLEL
jgi:hypothetical protein